MITKLSSLIKRKEFFNSCKMEIFIIKGLELN